LIKRFIDCSRAENGGRLPRTFTPLESPGIYAEDVINRKHQLLKKAGPKPTFLTGFTEGKENEGGFAGIPVGRPSKPPGGEGTHLNTNILRRRISKI
jgi:hypothetical protein